MRLIDADALRASAMQATETNEVSFNNCFPYWQFSKCIKEAPTIDAVPVVRGEWVVDECDTTDDVPSSSWIDFHCSECSMDYGLEQGQYGWCRYERIPYKYCPNCGAKMDKRRESEDE